MHGTHLIKHSTYPRAHRWGGLSQLSFLKEVTLSGTARRSNQSILKEISPEYSLEGLVLKLRPQYFGHPMQRTNSLEKTLMLGKIEGRRRRRWQRVRWLDGVTDSMDMCAKSLQSCLTLSDATDWSPPDSSVHGILQARILEWVAISSSRGSSQPRSNPCPSCLLCFFTTSTTWEALEEA